MKFTKWCGEMVIRMIAAERRRARLRETVMRLEQLDARALHDIGLHSTEIRSMAGEIAGLADATRVHSTRSLAGMPMLARSHRPQKELAR